MIRKRIGYFLGPLLFVTILLLPRPGDLSEQALKVAAIAVLMAVWWITEAIPIPATALLPVALFPSLGIMPSAQACAPYANHLIFLFLGGFFIAIAMQKWNLHRRVALVTIRMVGTSPVRIILGFMIATAFLSMWISNTATAMMMVPIAMAVIEQTADFIQDNNIKGVDTTPGQYRFGSALMLSIAYAASIGGVGTIIGTPPNTILVGFIENMYGQQISFAQWMLFGVPLAVTMLGLTWIYLVKIALPPEIKELPGGRALIMKEMEKLGAVSPQEKRILIVFVLVATAWIVRGFYNFGSQMMHDATIAIIGALALFVIPADYKKHHFLLDWQAALKVPWDVIILFGGGLALAQGFSETGLASWIGNQLTVMQNTSLPVLITAIVVLTIFLTEITSNTATSAMLIPVMGSIALAMAIHPFGLMVAAGIAASYAFMLPVATPPNAVVFGSRYITLPKMARVGFMLNILGVVLIVLSVLLLLPRLWGIDLLQMPEWFKTVAP